MTVRFSVTLKLHDVPTVRHIRDIEETLRLSVRGLCCRRDDALAITSDEVGSGDQPERIFPRREVSGACSQDEAAAS